MAENANDRHCRRHISQECITSAAIFLKNTRSALSKLCKGRDEILSTIGKSTPIDEVLLPQPFQEKTKFTILTCGLLNAGKSMFLNELLRGELQLPSNEMACTSRFVRIKYNKTPVMKMFDQHNDPKEIHFSGKTPPRELIALSEDDKNVESNIRVIIEIGIPHSLLQDGIEIIDCPGLGEDPKMSIVTYQFIKKLSPDLIIYMFDNRGTFSVLDSEKLDHIKAELRSRNVPILFVGNRIDVDEDTTNHDKPESCSDSDGYSFSDEEEEEESEKEDVEKEEENVKEEPHICLFNSHTFDKDVTIKAVQHYFKDALEEDIFGISAAKIYDHRTTKIQEEKRHSIFLDFYEKLENRVGEYIVELAVQDVVICKENLIRLARVFSDSVEDKALSLCYDETQTSQDLKKLKEIQLVDKLQILHKALIESIEKELSEKWNLLSYMSDIAKLVEDLQTRLGWVTLDSGTGSASLSSKADLTKTGISNLAQLRDITMFLVDRCVNVVGHCLRMCRYNDVIKARIEHFSRLILHYRVSFWHMHCALGNDMFSNVQISLREICMTYFKSLENTYIVMNKTMLTSDRKIDHAHYTDYLVNKCFIIGELVHYFREMVKIEEGQLQAAVDKRCDELERILTSVGIQSVTLQEEYAKVCFIHLQMDSLSHTEKEKSVLSSIRTSSDLVNLSEGFSLENTSEWVTTVYRPPKSELQLACIREIAKVLVIYDAYSFSNAFYVRAEFYHFDDEDISLHIICQPPKKRLLTLLPTLTIEKVTEYISVVLIELEKIHKSRRVLRNFRPDNFIVDKNSRLKLNLYHPCRPFLPLVLADGTLGPPFHIPPDHVKSTIITPAQEMYSFAWFVWILLEGSGKRVPTCFQGIGNSITDVERVLAETSEQERIISALNDLGKEKSSSFVDLLNYCWTLPVNTTVATMYDKIHEIL